MINVMQDLDTYITEIEALYKKMFVVAGSCEKVWKLNGNNLSKVSAMSNQSQR